MGGAARAAGTTADFRDPEQTSWNLQKFGSDGAVETWTPTA